MSARICISRPRTSPDILAPSASPVFHATRTWAVNTVYSLGRDLLWVFSIGGSNWLKQVAAPHCSFVSPPLPAVTDSQAKIQSKPGPHGWCHLSNLTNPVVKAEHAGPLMPTYLQPINIYLIPALEIACRCYSRFTFFPSPSPLLLSSHPSAHPILSFSSTVSLCYCFIVSLCCSFGLWRLQETQSVQWCNVGAWCNASERTTNSVNVLSTLLFFI